MKEVKQRVDAGNVNNKKYIMPNPKVKNMPRKQQMAVKASMAEQSPAKMKGKKKLKKVVKELKGASKMHAGQAKVINGMLKNSAFKSKPMIPMDTMAGEGNTKAFRLKEKARRGLGLTPRQLENDRYQQRKVTGRTNNQDGSPVPMKMKQSPVLKKLSAGCKAAARRKFDVYPSAYANMWASAQGRKGKC